MGLPKIAQPISHIVIPSTGRKTMFRPYTVAEEKILLMAKQSGDVMDVQTAVKQVIILCCLENIDDDELTIFDVEYLYIKLYAISVANVLNLTYKDNEDEKEYKVSINLDKVEVTFPEGHTTRIMITDTIGVVMRHPPAIIPKSVIDTESISELTLGLIKVCIKEIFSGEELYEMDSVSPTELDDWINSLTERQLDGFSKFLSTMPYVYHESQYTNSLGHVRKIELRNLNDFFSLR